MNKYYKNFILCGDIDQYCLLCKETFHLIPDIEKHIRWEKHRTNLKNLTIIPKFRKDAIYKIDDKYYCEICNIVTSNMSSVTEHVKCELHKLLKNNPEAKIKKPAGLITSGYVVINKVILNKVQWNSIVDNKCRICDIDVGNVDEHIGMHEHIIKLIQSETHYADNQYYRKVNGETFHCFACKKIYTATNFANHWENCENNDEIEIKKLKDCKTNPNIGVITDDMRKMAVIEKKLVKTLQEFYRIDETNNVALCKYCNAHVTIDFKSLIEHMQRQHNAKSAIIKQIIEESSSSSEDEVIFIEEQDSGLKRSELRAYGKANLIKLNFNGSKGYCTLCDRYLSAHINIFREHSKGALHRGHLEASGLIKAKNREMSFKINSLQSLNAFITDLEYTSKSQNFWINNEICVDHNAFLFLYPIPNDPHYLKTKCYACNEVFKQGGEHDHCLTLKHKKNFMSAKVLMNFGREFIREVRPNVYHCGYCNSTLPFLENLQRHLRNLDHLKNLFQNGDDASDDGTTNVKIKTGNADFYEKL